jgi:tRNA nucleotidyltransferase (CCA-adding enzyme)
MVSDELLLLYFSGHGIKDEYGHLYFATADTSCRLLLSTSISAGLINDLMRRSRARLQVLMLDCCYSGAFARGMVVKTDDSISTREYFQGRGRVVLTASDAMQYAFEGDQVHGKGVRSIFTGTLVEGLATGEADQDKDGLVTVDELYEYVHTRLAEEGCGQNPRKWVFDVEGDIVIARNPRPTVRVGHIGLLESLPGNYSRTITVAEVMSRDSRWLPPHATIASAAELMRRTGREGYPVADRGRVMGLLTRQMVDRALQFKMADAPVTRMMKAGTVVVNSRDSFTHLQQAIAESGWSTIPVVEEEHIVGVVISSELITSLSALSSRSSPTEVLSLMRTAFPSQLLSLLERIADTANEMGFSLYLVGEMVRNLLLGVPIVDVNMVIEGDAIALANHLSKTLGGRVIAHKRFSTAKWLLSKRVWKQVIGKKAYDDLPLSVDFASARSEFYIYPTALPKVERSSITQDLQRRDFTINTLAICMDQDHRGELLDFYGGLTDLHDGVIRVLHSLSFIDDPTRIFRAARLESQLRFRLAPHTEELIVDAMPLLKRVSGDRIRHEMTQIFDEPVPEQVLSRLEELGVMAQVSPSLHVDKRLLSEYSTLRTELKPDAWDLASQDTPFVHLALLLCRLDAADLDSVIARLKMKQNDANHLRLLPSLRKVLPRLKKVGQVSAICHLLKQYPARVLALGWIIIDDEGAREKLFRYQTQWRLVKTELTGHDLKAIGLEPGPLFGRLLGEIRDARLDGKVRTKEDEENLLQQLLELDRSQST